MITTDACEEQGLTIPQPAPQTLQALDRLLPPYWSRGNPVDLAGVTKIDLYVDCIEILIKDPNVDGVIALGAFSELVTSFMRKPAFQEATGFDLATIQGWEEESFKAGERLLRAILGLMKDVNKPVVVVTIGELPTRIDTLLKEEGLSVYPTPERAVRVMARLMEYAGYRRRWDGQA